MIALILVDKSWKTVMRNCRTYQGTDMVSGHSLVSGKFHKRLKCTQKHQLKKRYNIESLKDEETQMRIREILEDELAAHLMGNDVS